MSESFLVMRAVHFADGSVVTTPIRACDTANEARAVYARDNADVSALLEAQMVIPSGPGEVRPVGMTVREFIKNIGITGLGGGCYPVQQEGTLLQPVKPNLIRLS